MRCLKAVAGLMLTFVLLWGSTVEGMVLSDTVGTKYEQAVQKLVDLGIIDGYEDHTFRPSDGINRSEAAKMLLKMMDREDMVAIAQGVTPFRDVNENHWASGYVNLANQLGIMRGDGSGGFEPDDPITYEQMLKILVNALGYQSVALKEGGYPEGFIKTAENIGLTKDAQGTSGEVINRGLAAILLYNALSIDMMEQSGFGTEAQYTVAPGKTLGKALEQKEAVALHDIASSRKSLVVGSSSGGGSGSTASIVAGYAMHSAVAPMPIPQPGIIDSPIDFNTEEYDAVNENGYMSALKSPLSTFSIDVDTASYSNIRRMINQGTLPPKDAVRIEEMINYFKYEYPSPGRIVASSVYSEDQVSSAVYSKSDNLAFSVYTEVSECPWNENHQLALIGLKGKEFDITDLPPNNLVFLIDISGSMLAENKLPLLKRSLDLLVDQLRPQDRLSIVVYASTTGVLLDGAGGDDKETIKTAIENLKAGGSTAGASGIQLAYEVARKNFVKQGNNRVILGTDGDFNVGVSSESDLKELIESKRDSSIFLSVLGFGMGNIKDNKMELLAQEGNGNYAYIDNLNEAKKVLVEQVTGTLFTIAKDVKIQVEFNPSQVKEYRLIGYENRLLNKEDFNNDKKDAGELGAGHTVTALYELVPADLQENNTNIDDLKYQTSTVEPSNELMTVKLRYKEPTGEESRLITKTVEAGSVIFAPSDNLGFASAVAEFGMLLQDSPYKGSAQYDRVLDMARQYARNDEYRQAFIDLVEKAKELR